MTPYWCGQIKQIKQIKEIAKYGNIVTGLYPVDNKKKMVSTGYLEIHTKNSGQENVKKVLLNNK